MGWILPRIGIKMKSIGLQGFRGTVKQEVQLLAPEVESPIGWPLWKILVGKTLSGDGSSYPCTVTDPLGSRMIFI